MKMLLAGIIKIDILIYIIAGFLLCCMVLITLCDVILRNFGHPITGSMEIMQYAGCIVFSFSVPYATWMKVQIYVDLIVNKLKPEKKKTVNIITRIAGIVIFLFIAYNCFIYGIDISKTGECTPYFRVPLCPFAYIISFAFLMQGLTLFCDLIRTINGGENE
ncbi:MAG: TRAP transporter small permease [Spirochaetes bacterium]|nr:TRAP transporter small permease [Spirochaetota bacterium]